MSGPVPMGIMGGVLLVAIAIVTRASSWSKMFRPGEARKGVKAMPKKKTRDYGQTGPSLWDYLPVPQDLRRPLTDEEKYLYMDMSRSIKIPRAAHYFRLPSRDLPLDCQLSPEEVTALH